tara:strand:- start:315 stop:608 length:294 start_codon:yes stop_codon:yes gene_type:complete
LKRLDDYILEVTDNVRDDREVTKELLQDILQYLAKNEENHKYVGMVAAKYVETLQRSNEQLVKISSILQKSGVNSGFEMSLDDKDRIYDLINDKDEE